MIKRKLNEIQKMVSGSGLKSSFEKIQIDGVSIDSRAVNEGNLFIPIVRIKDGHNYVKDAIDNGAAASLWEKDYPNPPKDIPLIFVDNTLLALQKLATNYRKQLSAKVIGVTGSNGKTTTKDMIYSILSTRFKVHKTKGNLNSEYGLPLTLLAVSEDDEVAVLEMGMSNRGEIETLSMIAQPDIAIITMIGSSHIATLGSREEIANAKLEIIAGIKDNGLLIFYGDEPLLKKVNKNGDKKLRYTSFGISEKNDIYQTNVQVNSEKIQFKINSKESPTYSLNLIGKHNINNALAAISVAKELEITDEEIIIGLEELALSGMRMQQIKSDHGYTIINDAWNASPNSVQAAIETFHELSGYNRKILILSDMLELGENEIDYHKEIGKLIVQHNIDFLFTYGELAKFISIEAQKVFGMERVISYVDKKSLIDKVKGFVKPNDAILVKGSRGMALEDVVNALLDVTQ
ncbi:UDP-N-acetylmuramoyl-tripeptide--D-alanyl-D-alanine ligase [Solibacillus sp. CAU 1738]|uniref:UDP-N-acetylmuramoyl-tripeptide--D-alanyl-D- alanine ligase n=1 Tax=Solibacillus sp. CAU 1738 TaxID=3140363 RepID=UPI0032601F1D